MIVKVLGKGCKNCERLTEHVYQAAKELGLEVTVEKVKDMNDIVEYGVMKTPGLVINETVVSQGKILSIKAIQELFSKY